MMDLENNASFEFSDKSVRLGFIRKVYAILTLQLVITFGIVSIFAFIVPVKTYIQETPGIFWAALVISLVIILALGCAGDLRRKAPLNFIFLIIFTISEGVLLGCVSAYSDVQEVAIAIIATMAVAGGLTVFAFQTKIDFTMKSGLLVSLSMVLMTFMIFALIFRNTILYTLYACLGAMLFSAYLVLDTQLILGGKHKVTVSPEEYIFAALNLYLDIVNLFLMILTLTSVGD